MQFQAWTRSILFSNNFFSKMVRPLRCVTAGRTPLASGHPSNLMFASQSMMAPHATRSYTKNNGGNISSSEERQQSRYPDYRSTEGSQQEVFGGSSGYELPRFRHKGCGVFPRGLNFESSDRNKLITFTCKPAQWKKGNNMYVASRNGYLLVEIVDFDGDRKL